MRLFSLLLISIAMLATSTARANFIYEMAEKTSVGSVMNTSRIDSTIAYGIGSHNTGVTINNTYSLSTTNVNFHILAAKFNKLNIQTNIPFKDPEISRYSRVDSDTKTISASVDYLQNFNTELFYRSFEGYYVYNSQSESVDFKFPHFGYENIGLTTTYSNNPNHQSSYSDLLFYNNKLDSSAIMYFAKIAQLHFKNIDELNNINHQSTEKTKLSAANIKVLNLSIAYSRNWFWKNWFIGTVLGIGYNFNLIEATNTQGLKKFSTNSLPSSIVGYSAGYSWANNVSLTVNLNLSSSTTTIEDLDIANSTGTSGIYLSYFW